MTPKSISTASFWKKLLWLQRPWIIPTTAHIPPVLQAITDHVSGYVYAGVRGRLSGNSADTQPRFKHKGEQEARSREDVLSHTSL